MRRHRCPALYLPFFLDKHGNTVSRFDAKGPCLNQDSTHCYVGLERSLAKITERCQEAFDQGTPFDGIIGFSMGGFVAQHFLASVEHARAEARLRQRRQTVNWQTSLKYGILLSTGVPRDTRYTGYARDGILGTTVSTLFAAHGGDTDMLPDTTCAAQRLWQRSTLVTIEACSTHALTPTEHARPLLEVFPSFFLSGPEE